MNKLKFLLSLALLGGICSNGTAQMVGANAYMKGNLVEIGIDGAGGYEGIDTFVSPVPAGMHFRSNTSYFGFVANPQMNLWLTFDGDFFTPGTPENGWGFEIIDAGGVSCKASNNRSGTNQITATPGFSYQTIGSCIIVDHYSNYTGSGWDVDFHINYYLDVNDLFYTTTVTVTNNSGVTIPDFYYYRNFDPDNNIVISGDYSTTCTIVSQPGTGCNKAHVKATSSVPASQPMSYVGMAGVGNNFRVSYGGFSNRDGSDIWNGLAGLTGAVGATMFSDIAISLAYRIQSMAPGATETFKFVTILDDAAANNAINNLFYFDYSGSLGGPPPACTPTVDTVQTCSGMPVNISINGSAVSDFTWAWTPTTGIVGSPTGPSVMAGPSTTTTYTVTGTPINPCFSPVVSQIVVETSNGPDASYIDPGPQCGSFDLSTLVIDDLNNVPGAVAGFYTVVPATLADTAANHFVGTTLTSTDVVYVVYYDPILGCINSEQIILTWGSVAATLDVIHPSCGASDGEITVNVATPGTYTYSLNGAAPVATNVFSGLTAGIYTVVIDDGSGCNFTIDTTLASTGSATITSIVEVDPSCFGATDGSVTINITGGTAPINYQLNLGAAQTSNVFNSLGANTYNILITDDMGCTTTGVATLTNPAQLLINSVTATDVTCNGLANGQLIINATGGTGSLGYSVTGAAPFFASSTFGSLAANTYSILVEDANGCQATTTATITEPLPLTAPTGFQDESCFNYCDGYAVVAPTGGTTPYSINWSGPGGASSTSALFSNICDGVYNVSVTDSNGCVATGTVTLTSPAQIIISALASTPESCGGYCDGNITITAGPSVTQYSIDGGTTLSASNIFNSVCSGTFPIHVEDAGGCFADSSITLTAPPPVTIALSAAPLVVCIGQTANLTAVTGGGTGAISVAWAAPIGTTGSTATVDPAVTGINTYTATATDAMGCQATATVSVTENPPLSVQTFADTAVCPGAFADLGVILATGGNGGPYNFVWTNDVNGTSLSGASQSVLPAGSVVNYTVTLTDGCGTPAATESMLVTIWAVPTVSFIGDDLDNCVPLVTNFTNTTDPLLSGSCVWTYGDGGTSTICDNQYVWSTPGTYDVTLTVTTVNGCVVDTTYTNYVDIYAYPIPEFTWSPNPTDIFNPEVTFTNLTIGGNTYTWNNAGLDSTNTLNYSYEYSDDSGGVYQVCLTAENNYGCVAQVCHDVVVEGVFLLYAPNTFTPDGDGRNDVFMPIFQGHEVGSYEMLIFNRWGELIFRSSELVPGWDGTHKNMKAKEDTYVWKIRIKDEKNAKKYEYNGHVNLLR